MRRCPIRRRVVLTLAGVAVAAGCQPTRRPVATLPAVQLESSAVAGTLLDTTPATLPIAGPGTVGVQVTWGVVTRVPTDLLDPLDAHATLVSAPLAGGPVLTSGRQTAAARFGEGKAADELLRRLLDRTDGPVAQIGYQTGVIVPGSTSTFRLSADRADAAAPGRAVTVSLYLPTVTTDSPPQPATHPATQPATLAASRPTTNGNLDFTPDDLDALFHGPATTQADDDLVELKADYTTGPSDVVHGTISDPLPPSGSMTVTLEGFRDTPSVGDDAPATRPAITTTPETAYLNDLSLRPAQRFGLVFPCRLGNTPWRGIVVFIDIVDPPVDAGELKAIADAQFGRPSATQPATQPAVQLTLMRAIDALRTSADPRPPMLFLATATRATVAADAILVADRPTLDRLRSEVLQYADGHLATDAALDAAALGWHLDRAAVLALCEQQQAGKLLPELAAVLIVHGGEVGRHPDALIDAAKNVGSAADFKARVTGENTIALEDNSPAARVRAYDWLKAQGRAPEGYDPLADAAARRAAINRAISNTGAVR